jgi:hypothetical protein
VAIEHCEGQRSAAQPISQQPGPAIRVRRRPVLNADDRVVQLLRQRAGPAAIDDVALAPKAKFAHW